jgi:hypothetical protein
MPETGLPRTLAPGSSLTLRQVLPVGMLVHMQEQRNYLYFKEAQRFPLWIKAVVLMPVVVLGYPAMTHDRLYRSPSLHAHIWLYSPKGLHLHLEGTREYVVAIQRAS